MKPEQIIQDALEVAMLERPKSFIDKLFHREPSREKLQSSAIMYLTNRIIKAEEDKRMAIFQQGEILRSALNVIGMFSPQEQAKFHSLFSALDRR